MQGKILIVDAIATNRIVLKVKLSSAFYHVLQADTLAGALKVAQATPPDLILTSMDLPDGTAADLATKMAVMPLLTNVPMLAVGSASSQCSKTDALAAGVHDVMQKPLDDALLLGRVRSLIRASNAATEWRMRDDTSRALGLAENQSEFEAETAPVGRVMFVCADPAKGHTWITRLRPKLRAQLALSAPNDGLAALISDHSPDAFVLCLPAEESAARDVLGLISALRANAATRHSGLLVLQTARNAALGANALDLGADDLMTDGFDAIELTLRLKALVRRKFLGDQLRASVQTGLRAAIYDPLTGLHNRRYALPHLTRIAEHAVTTGRPFAIMIADMDYFKSVNDVYGHASGDTVLVETARRLRSNLRALDMVARLGGEEFAIVMPGTTIEQARATASRLCAQIGNRPFDIPGSDTPITVTISIGLAMGPLDPQNGPQRAETLLDMADKALYAAKIRGRNCVTISRPAA